MRGTWTIRRGLPGLAVLLLAAVVATLTAASYREVREQARAAAEARLERLAVELTRRSGGAESVARLAGAVTPALQALVSGGPADTAAARADLVRLAAGSAQNSAGVWDRDGRPILVVEGDSAPAAWHDLPPTATDTPAVSAIRAANDTTVFADVIVPLQVDGQTAGYLAQRRRVRVSATEEALEAVIGPGGAVLFGNVGGAGTWVDETGGVAHLTQPPARPGVGTYALGDTTYIGFAQPIPETPWLLLVGMREAHALAPANAYLGRIVVVAVALLLLGAFVAAMLSRRLTRPMAGVVEAASGIAAGDYSRRVTMAGPQELKQLASAFNTMGNHVERRTRELATSEARFRSLVTASSQVVWTTDPDGRVRGPIPSWQAFTGQEEDQVRGTGWTLAVHPDDAARMLRAWRNAIEESSPFETECRVQRHDGAWRIMELRAVPVTNPDGSTREWVGTGTDVTEKTQAERALREKEDELRQAQKMEAVGRLAGGVAHDFNNLLTAILGPVSMAQDHLPKEHPARAELDDIRTAALRAADLTRQLLTMSRQSTVSETVLDLSGVVSDTGRLLQRVIGERIELKLSPASSGCMVRADRAHLEQVILNLAVNARDAMPDGGRLTIETRAVELDEGYAAQHPHVEAGPYALLAITDTGSGIDPAVLPHIFEPFYTTKEAGKGTGLGLATVHGIVRQAGGHVRVFSQAGRGTTFHIYLPLVEADAIVTGAASDRAPARGGRETILLVEDDDAVRGVAVRSLARLGYEVIEAADGHEALERFAQIRDRVRLVVTDVVMPGMSGGELAERIAAERPGLPVLFLSGYADEAVSRGVIREGARFLRKPFTPDMLGDRVRALLDGATATTPGLHVPVSGES